MNKRFNLMILFLPLLLLVFSSGCKKLLDRRPPRATMEDLNQGGLEGQVYGLYGGIRNPDLGGAAWGHIPWLAIHSFRDDDAMKGSSDADGADWAVIYDNFQYSKDHWSTNIYYERKYQMVDVANVILFFKTLRSGFFNQYRRSQIFPRALLF